MDDERMPDEKRSDALMKNALAAEAVKCLQNELRKRDAARGVEQYRTDDDEKPEVHEDDFTEMVFASNVAKAKKMPMLLQLHRDGLLAFDDEDYRVYHIPT